MWGWIDRLGVLVLDASLGATLLVGSIALAMVGCRQPSRRVGLARVAVVGTLALLPLVALSPLPRLDLIRVPVGIGLDAHPILPYLGLSSATSARALGGAWGGRPVVSPSLRALTVLYLVGVGFGMAWLILGWWGLGWLTRRSTVPSPVTLELYDSLPIASRHRRPGLRVTSRVRGPVLIGLVRQTILIPPLLDRPEATDSLRMALLHELAHMEESDPWFGLAGGLAGVFWFFLPPLWWVRARMRLDHEFLADLRAASGFGSPERYAASLLTLSTPRRDGPTPASLAPVPVEGPVSALFQRLLMLVRCPFPVETRPPRWWRWSLPIGGALATLAASSLSYRGGEPAHPPGSKRPLATAGMQTFRMVRLQIPASPGGPDGHPKVFHLPIRLHDDFELTLEVWGDPDMLSRLRVAGLLLGTTPFLARDPTAPLSWHFLRVRRHAERLNLWIDGEAATLSTRPLATTPWLAIEPVPDLPLQVKNLTLIWPDGEQVYPSVAN